MFTSTSDRARFFGALLGAAVGALLALAMTSIVVPPGGEVLLKPGSAGALSWAADSMGSQTFQEDREKVLLAFGILFGVAGGVIGAWTKLAGARASFIAGIAMAASLPWLNYLAAASMPSPASFGLPYVASGLAAFIIGAVALRFLVKPPSSDEAAPAAAIAPATPAPAAGHTAWLRKWWPAIAGVLVLMLLTLPVDPWSIAHDVNLEMHQAVYMIAPALYQYADGLVPGLDYFTQYSIGTPWLFHFFLDETALGTIAHALWFQIAEMLFFELTLFFFLRWLFGHWGWALAIATAALILQFTTPSPLFAPSSTSSRYFMIAAVASLVVMWSRRDFSYRFAPALAAGLAFALFMNSETGIYACIAAAVATLAGNPKLMDGALRAAALAGMTFASFMLLSLIAFGPRVLSVDFIVHFIEPMLIYGGGLGASNVKWVNSLSFIYNVAAPGVALATVGWAIVALRRRQSHVATSGHAVALIYVGLIGLFMSAKYINMSLVALWQVNSWALVVVMAWWAKEFLARVPALSFAKYAPNLRTVAVSLSGILLFVFLQEIDDPSNPSRYGIGSYRTYPSAINKLAGMKSVPCANLRMGCSIYPVHPADVAMIGRLTKPGDRVAILDSLDWAYLVEAKRAPKFPFLPSTIMFTQRQIEQAASDLDLVFLRKTPPDQFMIEHGDLAKILQPTFRDKFQIVEDASYFTAWKRIKP